MITVKRKIMNVDIVYTWVNGKDPVWLEKRRAFASTWVNQNKLGLVNEPTGSAVSASSEVELFYSICSVKKYMPWINKVYIVTDKQVPVKTKKIFPDIIIVDHAEIFPANALLPTFNSHCIELALANIPGLSEYFIYMNDDVFINCKTGLEDFYKNEKILLYIEKFFKCFKVTSEFLMKTKIHQGVTSRSRCYTNQELTNIYGPSRRYLLQHSPIFIRKKTYLACQKKFSKQVESTYQHRFRHASDIVPATHLYPYYMLHEHQARFEFDVKGVFVPVTDSLFLNSLFYRMINKKQNFFCLNDIRYLSNDNSIKQMENFLRNHINFPVSSLKPED